MRQSLSVCLIVKNEAEMLPDCLTSIKDVADEIIVLDTGSTDDTVAIAKSFGAQVHTFEWIDDFSAARNACISHASKEWIFWLDADERLLPETRQALEKCLKPEPKPVLYRVRIKNLKEDGVNYSLSDAHRLFKRHPKIQFSGRIHEQISPSAGKIGAEERWSQIELMHLGYSYTDERKAVKQHRNRTLLEAQVQAEPNNAYAHYTLAHNYKADKKLAEARKHYQIALELNQFDEPMTVSLWNTYADCLMDLNDLDGVTDLISNSMKTRPRQYAVYFMAYRLALLRERPHEAIQALETLKTLMPTLSAKGSSLSTDIQIGPGLFEKTLGDLYRQVDNLELAALNYQAALEQLPENVKLLRNYFSVLEKQKDWLKALDILGKLVQLEGETPAYLNAIGMILMFMEEFTGALQVFLKLHELDKNNTEVSRRVASIYAKLGDVEQAKFWLEKSN